MSLLDVPAGHADVVLVYAITLLGARQDTGRAKPCCSREHSIY
ncbi:hypothetical protein [Bradyrhizobium sp. Tv2a-2]|nr:hypothetical protein [Bradyrhizobium sp. Tv2a-2]